MQTALKCQTNACSSIASLIIVIVVKKAVIDLLSIRREHDVIEFLLIGLLYVRCGLIIPFTYVFAA